MSWDGATAFQPGRQSETPSQKNKNKNNLSAINIKEIKEIQAMSNTIPDSPSWGHYLETDKEHLWMNGLVAFTQMLFAESLQLETSWIWRLTGNFVLQ